MPKRFSALAGILGPLIFISGFTIEGFMRPGYNLTSNYISELSLGPRGWIQITNFLILGTLFLIFTQAVAAEFQKGMAAKIGVWILIIIGIGFFLSGPLVMDPANTPSSAMTSHSKLHWIVGAIVFLLFPVSIFLYRSCFKDKYWQSFRSTSLILGLIVTTALILMTINPPGSEKWIGLIQRTLVIPYLIWIMLFSFKLFQKTR